MEPFKIIFDMSLEPSIKALRLEGEVELKHSVPHYQIRKINRQGQNGGPDLLPDSDIQCILVDGEKKWVHTDSGRESNLSKAAGQAIEQALPEVEIAEIKSEPDDDDD